MEKAHFIKQNKELKILLVEDDDGDAKAVKRAFKNAKIANPIIRVIDGVEALEVMRGENGREKLVAPYLLLVDLRLPRMSGLEFVKEVRNDAQLNKTIVFILTTSKDEGDIDLAYKLNVAGYIVKETAGRDFLNLVDLMNVYWRIIEFPEQ